MLIFNRLRAIFIIVAKRIISQPGLLVATLLGLVIAIALMMSIPLYADAVYYRIFMENIASEGVETGELPPFSFQFRYDGSIYGTIEWEEVGAVDAYLSQQAGEVLGLPQLFVVRYFSTDPFGIYADTTSAFSTLNTPLIWSGFAFVSDFENHITMLEGQYPSPSVSSAGGPIDVAIYETLATEIGLQVGETYIAFAQVRGSEGTIHQLQIPVRISGIWKERDLADPFWFFNPTAFAERMILPEETFTQRLSQEMEGEIYTGVWYLALDGSKVSHNDANTIIRRSILVQQKAAGLLANTKLAKSPVDAMIEYRRSANLLTILLYAFSVPIIGLLLAFITLTSGLAVERRRNEISVLRSRGAMALQMIGIAILESLLLGGVSLLCSAPTGMSIAQIIGQARSFLDFSAGVEKLRVTITAPTLRFGLAGVALVMAAQIIPTFSAAGHTVVSYKREQARMLRAPWWQRVGLDIILLVPAVYGAYLLRQQGSVVILEDVFGSNPLQNPLLFLVPALGIFALTLFFLRLMPVFMFIIARIAAHTKAVGLLMATRHLERTPGFYTTPLILLVLTLSLSAFTASLAYTLDAHLYDQRYYEIGADMSFLDLGEGTQNSSFTNFFGEEEEADEEEEVGPRWLFLPISDYLEIPGVEAASRIGRYPAVTRFSGGSQVGVFMGVDRASFSQIAFWRKDFSKDSLGALMNALAVTRNGILIPDEFMHEHALFVGDTVQVEVTTYGYQTEMNMQVLGSFDLFPTWYPSEGPLFVGNLDYLFEQAGGQYPYTVWIDTRPDTDYQSLGDKELGKGRHLDWRAAPLEIKEEQQLPERQGLFGLLSVGFTAAAVLTVLGFLLYALFSFRRRFIEFGVLRAVGLSSSQMASFLGWELAFLLVIGGGLGTLLGGGVSAFFIPFLQVGVDEASRIPPYVVDIAWSAIFRIYMLFGLLFIVALVALTIMLRRMKIFEAVKLGETT
ncbi:MAG: FtsX-like permease family protein [Anaerolineae bacterium]|nr:FtsX-like permease family protein [Anaerolineae bacterium]